MEGKKNFEVQLELVSEVLKGMNHLLLVRCNEHRQVQVQNTSNVQLLTSESSGVGAPSPF